MGIGPFDTETRTSGGSSETDMNALAVMPCTPSPSGVVTTVTQVANFPIVCLKSERTERCLHYDPPNVLKYAVLPLDYHKLKTVTLFSRGDHLLSLGEKKFAKK